MKPCQRCETLTKNDKYCSRSCAIATNNALQPKRITTTKTVHCLGCAKQIQQRPRNRVYCELACKLQYRNAQWMSGKSDATVVKGLANWARELLLTQAKYACTICGWSKKNPVTNKVPLQVDHIDGDWTNNVISNLRVLCFNCHALTPNYAFLNTSAQRAARGDIPIPVVRRRTAL